MSFGAGHGSDRKRLEKLLDAADAVVESDDFYGAMAEYKAAIDQLEDRDIDGDRLYYAQCFIDHGDLDEAWDYLAFLAVRRPKLKPKIRKEQVRILAARRQWSEALKYLLYRHVERCKYHGPCFSRVTFLRELEPIADALGLDGNERDRIADMIESHTQHPPYRVDLVDAEFRCLAREKGWA